MTITAPRLTADDYAAAAKVLGVPIASIRALIEVECAGAGFGPDGVRPIILFEPHQFYKRVNPDLREHAVTRGLAYAKWGTRPYPKSQPACYRQLDRAMSIDSSAALKSTSWGLGQIMGFNHKAAGYPTVELMVEAMYVSELEQLMALLAFLVTSKLDAPLRRSEWAVFARGYNGPGYAQHGYHLKLAAAYARHSVSNV